MDMGTIIGKFWIKISKIDSKGKYGFVVRELTHYDNFFLEVVTASEVYIVEVGDVGRSLPAEFEGLLLCISFQLHRAWETRENAHTQVPSIVRMTMSDRYRT